MIPPTTISAFLDEFERALKLSGRRRRRVLDEARDHLIEARERGISAGMDPFAAEIAAVEAFGDATGVASRFDPGRLAYLSHRVSGAVDRFDRWRAVHPTAGITVFIAPMALAMAVLWSPLAAALCFFGPWASMVWIGRQLMERKEPGYRHRLWGWKQEHPGKYQLSSNAGALLGWGSCVALEFMVGLPHVSPWLFLVWAPLVPLGWILNSPRRYQPPPALAA
jgi:hypothetical protein